jgi:hypothetical protein
LKPARANSFERPYLEKPFTKIGLVEWLKIKALSSTAKTKQQQQKKPKTVFLKNFVIDTGS